MTKRYLVQQSWYAGLQTFMQTIIPQFETVKLVSTFPGHIDDPEMREVMKKREQEYFKGAELELHDPHHPMQSLTNMGPCDLLIIDSLNMLFSNWMLRSQATTIEDMHQVWPALDSEIKALTGTHPQFDPFEGRVGNILILCTHVIEYPLVRSHQAKVYQKGLTQLMSDTAFEEIPVIVPCGSFALKSGDYNPFNLHEAK